MKKYIIVPGEDQDYDTLEEAQARNTDRTTLWQQVEDHPLGKQWFKSIPATGYITGRGFGYSVVEIEVGDGAIPAWQRYQQWAAEQDRHWEDVREKERQKAMADFVTRAKSAPPFELATQLSWYDDGDCAGFLYGDDEQLESAVAHHFSLPTTKTPFGSSLKLPGRFRIRIEYVPDEVESGSK